MFGNALFTQNVHQTPGRRHSHLDVSLAPKLAQRRATSPVINVDGMSPGLGYMMNRPSTPCFVTPTLGGFSGRRFSYDSPLQTLTALSSGGLPTLNRKAAKRAWAKMSTKKWSRSWKIIMILLLTSFAVTLFLVRKSRESTVPVQTRDMNPPPCNEHAGTCDAWEAHLHENNPKEEFMEMVTQAEHFHEVEEGDLWVNRWTAQGNYASNEVSESQASEASDDLELNVVEQEPLGLNDLPSKVLDYVESVKSFIGDQIPGSDIDEGKAELEGVSPVQESSSEITAPRQGNDHHSVPHPDARPMQGLAQGPSIPQQPGHMQDPKKGVAYGLQPPVDPSQHLQHNGQASAPRQQYHQGITPQHPTGHLRPSQPQVIGVPAHHMPQQPYAHPMPNAGQPLPPGVNPLRYNQHSQPHYNQHPQPRYNQHPHNQNQGIIGHNHGQRLPPGVNPHHYRGF